MSHAGVRCMLMRGGTSKGAYFVGSDVPREPAARTRLFLDVMGSPDPRQIDGLGGAHPLTSKVAVVSPSREDGVDLDYEFFQVAVDEPTVSTAQTCGNLLAGIGPFAVERGLLPAHGDWTTTRIRLVNTGDLAVETFATRDGLPVYDGGASGEEVAIDGVPGTGSPITIELGDLRAGKPLFPTGRVVDEVLTHEVTIADNGMPVAMVSAGEFGLTGYESPEQLEANDGLRKEIEALRLECGELGGWGDVTDQTIPKVFLLAPPRAGGLVSTRGFIPHRVHQAIGVLMAASVAAALRVPGTVGSGFCRGAGEREDEADLIEHPSGAFPVRVRVARHEGVWRASSVSVRTARKIFDGTVFTKETP